MDQIDSKEHLNLKLKKMAFSPAERKLLEELVRERPIIENKRLHYQNIRLKKQAWEDLTMVYNSHQYVSQRVTLQLKRCWENIKTQRRRELTEGSPNTSAGRKHKLPSVTDEKNYIKNEQELHDLKIQRENISIEREKNLLEHEKKMQDLQVQKIKLEIELLAKQVKK